MYGRVVVTVSIRSGAKVCLFNAVYFVRVLPGEGGRSVDTATPSPLSEPSVLLFKAAFSRNERFFFLLTRMNVSFVGRGGFLGTFFRLFRRSVC